METATGYGSDEYLVLAAMLCGMLAHALLTVRVPRRMLGVLACFLTAAIGAWLLAEAGPERWMQSLFFTAITFAVLFAIVFRERLMPVLTPAGLAHYTMLLYYGLSLSARDAGVSLPSTVLIVGALPALFVVILLVLGARAGPGLRKLAYAWFLLVLTALLLLQLGQLAESGPRRGEAQLGEAVAWFFFLGPLWLYFVSNVVYLLLMLPAGGGAGSRLWRSVLGNDDFDARHRDAAARRVRRVGPAPLRVVLLLAHGLLLAANWRYGLVPHGLMISASVIALVEGESLIRGKADGEPATA